MSEEKKSEAMLTVAKDALPTLPNLVDVTSMAEFEAALKAAPGTVIVSMLQEDCGGCVEERPLVEKLAAKCATTTVIRVDIDKAPDVADKLDSYSGHEDGWGGTPTLLVAASAEALLKGDVEETEPEDKKLLRRLRCARK